MAKKTFKDLKAGDVFYVLKDENTIVELICKGIVFHDGYVNVYYNSTSLFLNNSELTSWTYSYFYVNKSDVFKEIHNRQQKHLQQLYSQDIELNKEIQLTINSIIETSKNTHKELFNEKQI